MRRTTGADSDTIATLGDVAFYIFCACALGAHVVLVARSTDVDYDMRHVRTLRTQNETKKSRFVCLRAAHLYHRSKPAFVQVSARVDDSELDVPRLRAAYRISGMGEGLPAVQPKVESIPCSGVCVPQASAERNNIHGEHGIRVD